VGGETDSINGAILVGIEIVELQANKNANARSMPAPNQSLRPVFI
jgi:hypothetical protein